MFGFIFTRHVNSNETNEYWKECIRCIRKHYQNNIIMVIDDNSSDEYVTNDNVDLRNCFIIQSEYPKRGEILSYYYFYKYKLFDKAIIIHDSVFLQQDISQEVNSVNNVKFLWHFKNRYDDNAGKEIYFIHQLKYNHNEDKNSLINVYLQRDKWLGCFGVMSVITYDFLNVLVDKYNVFSLLNIVKNREERCSLERVFSILCYVNSNYFTNENSPSIFGEILEYPHLGKPFYYTYTDYLNDKHINKDIIICKIIKVWSGR